MSSQPSPSLLEPIQRYLRILAWLGFPLRQASGKDANFLFNHWFDYWKLVMIVIVSESAYVLVVYSLATVVTDFTGLINLLDGMGFSVFDVIVVTMVISIAMFSNLNGFCKLARLKIKLTSLFRHLESVCLNIEATLPRSKVTDPDADMAETCSRCFKGPLCILILTFALTLSIGIVHAVYMYFCFVAVLGPIKIATVWVSLALFPVAVVVAIGGGPVLGAELMLNCLPNLTAGLLGCYTSRMRHSQDMCGKKNSLRIKEGDEDRRQVTFNTLFSINPETINPGLFGDQAPANDIFDVGLRICDLILEMSDLFASFYVGHFFTCTLLSTISLYTASTVFYVSVDLVHILNTATYFLLAAFFIMRMVGSSYFGQVLDDACKKASIELDAHLCEQYDCISEKERCKVRILADRLKTSTPFTPWGFFQVNHGTLVAAGSVVLTYLIILVQIKTSSSVTSTQAHHETSDINDATL